MESRIQVGISACLMGEMVRHDGGHKHSRYCTEVLSQSFDFKAFCPEVGAGLGVPRPAMRLVGDDQGVRLRETRSDAEHTDAMQNWIDANLERLEGLRGFVFMQKSPSCGMERVRVYRSDGELLHRDGEGLFAAAVKKHFPLMPVEESGRLNDDRLLECFIERVFVYDDWLRLREGGLTPARLIDFHTRHKFQLLAHCQNTYRRLGPLLSDLSSDLEAIADEYIHAFMAAMGKTVSPGAHVNTMQHLLGFFRDQLEAAERRTLVEQIDAYGRGEVPLVVPMTLLRLAQRRFPDSYLAGQAYLQPYPDNYGLRNRV
jgi:uncharacterized protein YbgA (DUF1722 family)/uncharacterized protein YbbK (DUF523 family)